MEQAIIGITLNQARCHLQSRIVRSLLIDNDEINLNLSLSKMISSSSSKKELDQSMALNSFPDRKQLRLHNAVGTSIVFFAKVCCSSSIDWPILRPACFGRMLYCVISSVSLSIAQQRMTRIFFGGLRNHQRKRSTRIIFWCLIVFYSFLCLCRISLICELLLYVANYRSNKRFICSVWKTAPTWYIFIANLRYSDFLNLYWEESFFMPRTIIILLCNYNFKESKYFSLSVTLSSVIDLNV